MISEFRASLVVSESFLLMFRHFLTIFSIAFICCLPMTLLLFSDMDRRGEAFANRTVDEIRRDREERESRAALAGLSIYVTYPLATGAIALAVYRSLRGERVSFFESFGAAVKRIFALFGVFICSILAVGASLFPAGFFASALAGQGSSWMGLVVALLLACLGVVVMMMVSVASPVCVVERKGVFASLRRSQELTAGYRWRLFLALFGVAITGYLLLIIVAAALGMIEFLHQYRWTALTLGAAAITFLVAWTATATALAYYQLRSVKESVDIVDVAAVFD